MNVAETERQPQHLVLVLPSSAEFDSRTYRIATTAIARGHRVTVLARWHAGLPDEEVHPAGYRIVRIHASSIDGLPFPWLRAFAGAALRRIRGRPLQRSAQASTLAPPTKGPTGSDLAGGEIAGAEPATPAPTGSASLPRRAFAGLVRRLAIPLTIRSHRKNALPVAPAADLYHGMAYMGIPVALALGRRHRAPVVYDARDIYLEARNLSRMRGPARWLLATAERRWAHSSARVITVNEAYADVLERSLRVPRPLIVMNCSYRYDPPDPPVRRFHDRLGLPAHRHVVLYHGGLFAHRGIEELITAIADVPGADLVLMGYGVLAEALPAIIASSPAAKRIHILPAVPPQELHDWVAAADIVAMPIQPSTLNHRLTTPNKLFEAMAAGVPIVASDLPGMATIVSETRCGVLCDPIDPSSIATAIRRLLDAPSDEREAFGIRGRTAAHETYNWETQAEILFGEYGRLTGRPW
ncbi:MAG TPA: glycosyltransferase family 4 protein [Candidatus Limnocylindrales bacterium]|jgi:glycosyltransferase involved in cell wall biosynthesis|nr:glycosyltransferase family 4 protein [Candidatus Limnocylindrales bacterium]